MTEHFQRYRVGGAVRDRLLREEGYDLPAGDVDWVVVGATPESMVKAGYLPVGADFPVFLHPTTHEEHAPGSHRQRHGGNGRRHGHRSVRGATRSQTPHPAAREQRLLRRPGAHSSNRPLCGQITGLYGRSGNAAADATNG